MGFRTHEHVVPDIQADAATSLSEQMVAADKISAGEGTTVDERSIEADALAADAGGQFGRCPLTQLRVPIRRRNRTG